jgi:hypothetical protein
MAQELIYDAEDFFGEERPRDVIQFLELITCFNAAAVHFGIHDLHMSAETHPGSDTILMRITSNAPTDSKRVKKPSLTSSPGCSASDRMLATVMKSLSPR